MSHWQITARKDTITDALTAEGNFPGGRVLDDRAEYHCIACGRRVINHPLEGLSRALGREVYGHVTCPCQMRMFIKRRMRFVSGGSSC